MINLRDLDEGGAAVRIKDAKSLTPYEYGVEYGSPARGMWNIVHTGMLVPESHQIFVCAQGCLRGVVLTAALAVLAVIRAGRRREVQVYAWLMPASTVVQAIIGGITVRTGLLWWTVAVHLLVSMVMVWLAVLLYVKIGEPDSGTDPAIVTLRHAELDRLRAHVFLHGQRPGTYGVYYEYPNPLPDMPSSIENQPLARVLDGLRMHFDA